MIADLVYRLCNTILISLLRTKRDVDECCNVIFSHFTLLFSHKTHVVL